MYAVKWILTLFTYVLPFTTVARVWDLLLVMGPSKGVLLISLSIVKLSTYTVHYAFFVQIQSSA